MSQFINPELLETKKRMEQKISEDLILKEIGAIHSIYFDLPLLQDVYVGALLLNTHNEQEYNNILASIPFYQSRIDKDICKYFPSTDMTDDTLFAYLKDPKNAENLFKISPHTNLWDYLSHLTGLLVQNNRVVDDINFHCDFYINLYPVPYPPIACRLISNYLKNISANITLKTIYRPFIEIPKSIRTSIDMFFLEDNSVLMSDTSPLRDEMYVENLYDNKHIFAKRCITADPLPTEELSVVFDKSKYLCNIFTHFEYVDIFIPNVEYIPPVKEHVDPAVKHKVSVPH